ncbi:class I SAM-dependent methyltransferase [Paenibacillus sp. GCM10023248]|uniref:class I SAM-dependent methyltransferase n=1 Tax=unclassified Paenibacillus TaxID=185978 RepID=UPI002378BB30|nr:SAM-dependent methyltransferase [Paenibacillus sp. MAHUQ-63]MDD9270010.1 SAM-dependent methyltransferase [Paenibacillus sp. MAHUQ-63]
MKHQLGHPEVIAALIEAIRSAPEGAITFRDYMELCLYSEPYGYYRSERPKIGKEGDFYTSSSIGSVMGEMIAAFLAGQAGQDRPLHLVEWGGGSGRLALHLLDEMRRIAPGVYECLTYTLIESSAYHRSLQQQALQGHAPRIRSLSELEWLAEEPEEQVYVLANELLDAFPVHRIRWKEGGFQESYVTWQETDQAFAEIWRPIRSKLRLDSIESLKVQWIDGQIGELNLESEAWIARISQRMISGGCILIDYGAIEAELYAPHRYRGTLMCYRNHQAHDDVWVHQGEQDITAHVNFSAVESAARLHGFASCKLQTQREFLVEQGILQKLQDHDDSNPFSEVSKRNRAIRQLLLSDGMSELFKVFTAVKSGNEKR